jgi:formate-dependent phosphoribosylglycinamide formyltransferase (GAR transformylase)
MSSSGKGQSTIKTEADEKAWNYAVEGSRGDVVEVIVEAFVQFRDYLINRGAKQQSNYLRLLVIVKNARTIKKLAASFNFRQRFI